MSCSKTYNPLVATEDFNIILQSGTCIEKFTVIIHVNCVPVSLWLCNSYFAFIVSALLLNKLNLYNIMQQNDMYFKQMKYLIN